MEKKAQKCTWGTISGPKTLPCGTPDTTLTSFLRQPSTIMHCDRFHRNCVNIANTEPPIPTEQRLYRECLDGWPYQRLHLKSIGTILACCPHYNVFFCVLVLISKPDRTSVYVYIYSLHNSILLSYSYFILHSYSYIWKHIFFGYIGWLWLQLPIEGHIKKDCSSYFDQESVVKSYQKKIIINFIFKFWKLLSVWFETRTLVSIEPGGAYRNACTTAVEAGQCIRHHMDAPQQW